ncbi:citrate/2-methylcitrate synthase [Antrihabitans stalactiti]|uniref:Citrate synthase n=1 Tax=Antrihabitans stalactiti TaxID=2584121 RepID=A0A848KIU6_9NOCA|nr:citrate/2-methylcitrate synthase [Antrihabitans stalactiti]NMN96150.1 citrate synthase/methylcitrate synthase [Antrihabitans stalactiti]
MDVLYAPRGLSNVVVTSTDIGDVRGLEGFYHYRQYSAIDLATSRSLEDVWFLFVEGRLPDATERDRFAAEVAPLRAIPADVLPALRVTAMAGATPHPLAGLRTILSLVAASQDMAPTYGSSDAQRRADALLVCAVTPTILAALHRIRTGREPLEPRDDLSAAENWLYLVTGTAPEPAKARAIEQYLIATIDHGFNASTFTARVAASAGADVASAVCAAIGSFSGPLHGGAPDRALDALDEIGSPDRAAEWVRAKVTAGGRIMGFGHAVYRTDDPRAVLLRSIAQELGGDLVDFATSVERIVVDTLAELKPDRKLYANVEFYAGVVMELCGIPRSMFTPTFATSRVIGWCANILEQSHDPKIIRPIARYAGPAAPQAVPVA